MTQNTPQDTHTEYTRSPTTFITYRLARVQNLLNAQAIATLRTNSDLSLTEWRVLSLIVGEETTNASAISRLAQMDKGQISRGIKRIAGRGYIESQTDDHDHRQINLTPTPKGIETYERLVKIMRRRQRLLNEDITDDERRAFFATLDKLETRAKEPFK